MNDILSFFELISKDSEKSIETSTDSLILDNIRFDLSSSFLDEKYDFQVDVDDNGILI